jgi:hypothetical protein
VSTCDKSLAPAYLTIAGRWQDHILFQVVADQVG